MQKKIIFSDFDATLVGRDLQVSERVKEAILAWEKEGNLFSIATGRMFGGYVKKAAQELQLTSPQVTMGGAQIVDPVSKEILYQEFLPDEDVEMLFKALNKRHISFWAEKDFIIYNERGEPAKPTYASILHKKLTELTITNIPKVAIRPKDEREIAVIQEVLTQEFPRIHFMRAGSPFGVVFDITAAAVTKHSAVLRTIEMVKVDREQTIGIGDGYNDFPLLTVTGYKVAMGNAVEELKEIADFVTEAYDKDGVAVVIEKLLKN